MATVRREILEDALEKLHRSLSELRPRSPDDVRRSSIIVAERMDRWGNFLYLDPRCEEVLGNPPACYEAEPDWTQWIHPKDLGRLHTHWVWGLNGRPCRRVEYRFEHADGRWLWIEESFRPILADARGQTLVFDARWHDVTPRKRREQELLIAELERSLRAIRAGPRPGVVIPFPPLPALQRRRNAAAHRSRGAAGAGFSRLLTKSDFSHFD
ncbi:MAG: PAS domain-containing protein [Acidobacteriota bacterium]